MKLRNIIDARGLEYGSTASGAAWCVKALHPADALSECRGYPDHSNLPSVHLGYESIQTINPPAGAVGSWGFDLAVTPHPISFCWAHTFDEAVGHQAYLSHLNPQLDAGVTHRSKYEQWKSVAQRWRLTYAGVTMRQDAASVANQGVVVACQAATVLAPVTIDTSQATANMRGRAPSVGCTASDLPEFDRVQSMPQSYHGLSKDGVYMPIRLSDSVWHSERDEATNWGPVNPGNILIGSGDYGGPPQGATSNFPFEGLTCPYFNPVGPVEFFGDTTSPLCNGYLGNVCMRNLALTTRISITYRFGFEVQVQPGTLLSPQQQLSPAYDARALETYNAISRELHDAYPEEYNSLSKIWEVIKTVGRAVLPAVAKNVPILGDVMKIYKGVSDNLHSAASPADVAVAQQAMATEEPSLAEKERTRKVISAARVARTRKLLVKRR